MMLGTAQGFVVVIFLAAVYLPLGTCADGSGVFADQVSSCPVSNCDGTGVLAHHSRDTSVGGSVACLSEPTSPGFTRHSAYLRCFPGSLCSSNRIVESVFFRVKQATTSVVVDVNIFKGGSNGCNSVGAVGSLHSQQPVVTTTAVVNPGFGAGIVVPIPQTLQFSPTESLLVEISVPSLLNVGGFFMGDSNEDGQCAPSYLQTDTCGDNRLPFTTASIRFESVSFIIGVNTVSLPTQVVPQPMPQIVPRPAPQVVPQPAPQLVPTNPPVEPPEEGCLDAFDAFLACAFDYLFGWLLPF